jgi:acetyl esterase/lipase
MSDLLRLLGGCVFLALAALAAIGAPNQFLWKLSVAATEGGHWLAVGALVPAMPWWGRGRLGKIGGLLSLGAAALFALPLYYASQMNRDLPAMLDISFGTEHRARGRFAEDLRPEPVVMFDLVTSVQSRPVRLEERVFSNADGESLTLDIYKPGYDHGPLPGLLVINGGNWQSGESKEFIPLNAYLAARDYVVVSINYRLPPKWKFPAGRDDVLSAIAYLKVYANELGLDPTRLALLGRSAGGQLALLAAYTAGEPSIRGVVSVYGPTDLKFGYDRPAAKGLFDTRGMLESYLGGSPAKADDAYFAASPINFVTAASPPTLLIHGLHDGHVSPEESERLEARLSQAKVKNLFVRLPWATHACDWSFSGPCGQITTYAIERFLERVMFTPAKEAKPQGRLAMKRSAQGSGLKAQGSGKSME